MVCDIFQENDMQVLRKVLVALALLSSVHFSSAQREDQIVSKAFPANITCRRDRAQRSIEQQEAVRIGGSETLLVLRMYIRYYINMYRCMHV